MRIDFLNYSVHLRLNLGKVLLDGGAALRWAETRHRLVILRAAWEVVRSHPHTRRSSYCWRLNGHWFFPLRRHGFYYLRCRGKRIEIRLRTFFGDSRSNHRVFIGRKLSRNHSTLLKKPLRASGRSGRLLGTGSLKIGLLHQILARINSRLRLYLERILPSTHIILMLRFLWRSCRLPLKLMLCRRALPILERAAAFGLILTRCFFLLFLRCCGDPWWRETQIIGLLFDGVAEVGG